MIGGMITEKTIKYTKTNQAMAFLTIEDLLGTVEVVVFPRDYGKYQSLLEVDSKVFIRGRANVEEEKNGKLICERVYGFDEAKRELWIQFPDKEQFIAQEDKLYKMLAESDGKDSVVIYLSAERARKRLPDSRNIEIEEGLMNNLTKIYGENNVKVVEKAIENLGQRY